MTHEEHERNAEEFARMMGGEPSEERRERPPVPTAPSAPESRIIRETPTRRSAAGAFADMLSRSLTRRRF